MEKDTRAYITVADEFPEHPKTLELSDAAFRAVIELWCYSNRRKTDGKVPAGLIRRYAPDVIEEMLTVGFMTQSNGKHAMHDYLSHQKSKVEIEQHMSNKKEAGRRGGMKSAHMRNHVKKGFIDPNCEDCPGVEPDEEQ